MSIQSSINQLLGIGAAAANVGDIVSKISENNEKQSSPEHKAKIEKKALDSLKERTQVIRDQNQAIEDRKNMLSEKEKILSQAKEAGFGARKKMKLKNLLEKAGVK